MHTFFVEIYILLGAVEAVISQFAVRNRSISFRIFYIFDDSIMIIIGNCDLSIYTEQNILTSSTVRVSIVGSMWVLYGTTSCQFQFGGASLLYVSLFASIKTFGCLKKPLDVSKTPYGSLYA